MINPVSISTAVISPIELLNTTISPIIINEYFEGLAPGAKRNLKEFLQGINKLNGFYTMMRSTLVEFDKRPVKSYNDVMRAYTPHPEAPKNGEQVMTVDFKSCDLDEYNSLQERINEIREKLEEDDDDDDDDGNVLALNR